MPIRSAHAAMTMLADCTRRKFLAAALAMGALPMLSAAAPGGAYRIGLTPVFLDDMITFLDDWRAYLARQLDAEVRFVRRGSYAEVVDLLLQDQLDFAWLCGFPYVTHRSDFDLLAVPVFRGEPLYQSYLIVPAQDERTRTLSDLSGRVFAYSDPNSNSGYLYTQYRLARMDAAPGNFFRRTFFTGAHRAVIEAVSRRLADGGAVDGYVYDALVKLNPEVSRRTRIVERSPRFGFPPFVAHRRVEDAMRSRFQQVLFRMSEDPEGRRLLDALFLDGFTRGRPALYDDIARMAKTVSERDRVR